MTIKEIIMCVSGQIHRKKRIEDPELLRHHWERLIYRGFIALGSVLFMGFVAYLLWFLQ